MDRRRIILNNHYEMYDQNEAESDSSRNETRQNGNQYVV